MNIAIRKATEEDAEILSSLNADVQALHAAALPGWFKTPGPDTFPASVVATLVGSPANFLFIADSEGNLA
jgi:hypothetical protein